MDRAVEVEYSRGVLERPSLITRLIVGKSVGFAFGLLGLIFLPYFMPDSGWLLRWGVLLWYTSVGAVIAVFGVVTWHPILKAPMPWWLAAPLIGGWLNFVLTFFAYDTFRAIMISAFGPNAALQSPFWFTAEGAIVGFVIGYFATRFGGEGPQTAGK